MSTTGFLIEILLDRYNTEHTKIIFFFFTYITHKLKEHLVRTIFHDYDVTALKVIHLITFRNYTKHPIKVLQN